MNVEVRMEAGRDMSVKIHYLEKIIVYYGYQEGDVGERGWFCLVVTVRRGF